ncbi:hypothetical protein LCGC14_2868780, partial [marine sediment metagenome]
NFKPGSLIIDSMGIDTLEIFKGLVDDAFRDTSFNLRQSKAGEILPPTIGNSPNLQTFYFLVSVAGIPACVLTASSSASNSPILTSFGFVT